MPENENKAVASPREQLLERASSRYPDRVFQGQTGQDGQEGQDDLEQAILDMISEQDTQIAESKSKNDRLVELFTTDPSSAEFVQKWIETGDPRVALVETFGDDLSELSTEEGRSQFSENLQSWRDRRAENDRLNTEADENWQKSLNDLDSWGDEKGLDNDKKAEVILRLIRTVSNGLMNIYGPEDFDMVLKEMNYDNDVATARQEGEVAGRNAKIAENRRSRSSVPSVPPTLNGQGGRSAERRPRVEENEDASPFRGIV